MRRIIVSILAGSLAAASFLPLSVLAKTATNVLSQPDWFKYGVNPWATDTDNDGLNDLWEVRNDSCPTFPGTMSLRDARCLPGSFDLKKGTFTPPAHVSFYPPRTIQSVASCPALQKVLALTPYSKPALDEVLPYVAVYGSDEVRQVQTDNQALFVLAEQKVHIVSLASEPHQTAELKLSPAYHAEALYLDGTTLVTVGTALNSRVAQEPATMLELWDVKNVRAPKLVRTLELSGKILGTHIHDGSLYAAVTLESNLTAPSGQTYASMSLPELLKGIWFYRDLRARVGVTSVAQWKPLSRCANVEYFSPVRTPGFVELVAVSLRYPLSALTTKTLWGVGSGDSIYFTSSNLYVVSPDNNYSWLGVEAQERTELYRLNLNKNRLVWAGAQTVPGTIVPGALDEYQGKIRVVTVMRRSPLIAEPNNFINGIYVLDSQLTRLVWSEGFAPYERALDAQFLGNRIYVRTDHEAKGWLIFEHAEYFTPKEVGRVVIPGITAFAALNNHSILGLGKNDVPAPIGIVTTSPGFTIHQGLKFSMVSLVNPAASFELPVFLGERGTNSVVFDAPSLLATNTSSTLAAFPVRELAWSIASSTIPGIDPHTAPFTRDGVVLYALDPVVGPQLHGAFSLSSNTAALPPVTLGLFFRSTTLYTVTDERLVVRQIPSLAISKEIVW